MTGQDQVRSIGFIITKRFITVQVCSCDPKDWSFKIEQYKLVKDDDEEYAPVQDPLVIVVEEKKDSESESITLGAVHTSKPSDLSLEDITSADKFEYQSEEEYEEGYEVGYVDGYEEGSGYEEEPGSMEEDNYVPSDLEYKY